MVKYKFNDEIFETINEAEEAVRKYAEDTYDEMLDECYEEVNVFSWSVPASIAFESIDPIAYRCGLGDYENSLYDEIEEFENYDEEAE